MKIGNKTYRRQHDRSLIMGIGSDVSDLTGVMPALPKWIIPDKGHQSWKLAMVPVLLQVTSTIPKRIISDKAAVSLTSERIISDKRLPTASGTRTRCPELFLLRKSKASTGEA